MERTVGGREPDRDEGLKACDVRAQITQFYFTTGWNCSDSVTFFED